MAGNNAPLTPKFCVTKDDRLTTRPQCDAIRSSIAAFTSSTSGKALIESASCTSPRVRSRNAPFFALPAFETIWSTRPNASRVADTSRTAAPSSDRSPIQVATCEPARRAASAVVSRPSALLRVASMRLVSSPASRAAVAAPIPLAAPVMITTRVSVILQQEPLSRRDSRTFCPAPDRGRSEAPWPVPMGQGTRAGAAAAPPAIRPRPSGSLPAPG